jgi:hypothetical protein
MVPFALDNAISTSPCFSHATRRTRNDSWGLFAVYRSGNGRGRDEGCAESVCAEALGQPSDIQFTPAMRPRTGQPVAVCANREATYGRGAFPDPATTFQTDRSGQR